eukprot:CAMPEP_0197902262 /NCGR_PEP_ID=MMETSP1439-20131203/52986_1 /TAXON_ID=66791 /ORGANISM="Gonyaulax spinifera, Strain CCMP409" /LENGTH=176 /DNA_ID=CAMNT_0043523273 /DNA_START=34 /DNA_END=564 /DNA_ORIENTATION=+
MAAEGPGADGPATVAAGIGPGGAPPADAGPTTNAEDQRAAAALRSEAGASAAGASASAAALAALPGTVIDEGTFKYVLMQVTASTGEQRYLVRGTYGASYHKDVAAPYARQWMDQGFVVEILGGGRILHDPSKKHIRIYGFSYGFPWVEGAGHSISSDVCRADYPGYEVDWSDEGY